MCARDLEIQCLHFISNYIIVRADYVQHYAISCSAQFGCATCTAHRIA